MKKKVKKMAKVLQERIAERRKFLKIAHQIANRHAFTGGLNKFTLALSDKIPDLPEPNCSKHPYLSKECYKDAFSCQEPNHDCSMKKGAYICGEFSCTLVSFTCEKNYDHVCGDMFECGNAKEGRGHSCEAIHGFFCDDEYYCYEGFTCKSPGEPGGKCIAGAGYNMGGDTTEGDFLCGIHIKRNDDFDCNTDFKCTSKDDFRCVETTDFDCGTGDPGDGFSCSKKNGTTQFQCDGGLRASQNFSCNPKESFSCKTEFQCKKPNPFDCASYACARSTNYIDPPTPGPGPTPPPPGGGSGG